MIENFTQIIFCNFYYLFKKFIYQYYRVVLFLVIILYKLIENKIFDAFPKRYIYNIAWELLQNVLQGVLPYILLIINFLKHFKKPFYETFYENFNTKMLRI